jgi:predicted DNA repair protein MutK
MGTATVTGGSVVWQGFCFEFRHRHFVPNFATDIEMHHQARIVVILIINIIINVIVALVTGSVGGKSPWA